MHERTMRTLARCLFVGCCASPTALTMLLIVLTWTPWYHRRCLRELEASIATRTGLAVAVGNFQRITPTSWQLSDVSLSDPETQRSILKVRQVWWVVEGGDTVIRLSQPELQSRSLDQIWYLIHDRFLCRPEQTDRPVRLAADDLTIHGRTGSLTLRDIDGWMRPGENNVAAWVRCIPAGEATSTTETRANDGVQIQITRDRAGDVPQTQWHLQTGSIDVPLAMLVDYWPSLGRLGDDATFRGSLLATQSSRSVGETTTWDLSGSRIESIDLRRLSESMPHGISGRGSLVLDRCQLDDWKLVNVVGTFRGRDGWMSPALLPRLAEDLGWRVDGAIDRDFKYDLIATHFDLYASQLKLSGVCGQDREFGWLPADVVVVAAGQPVALSHSDVLPATSLARLTAPSHSTLVPLSGQTSGLLRLLQLPNASLPGAGPYQGLHAMEPTVRIGNLRTENAGSTR